MKEAPELKGQQENRRHTYDRLMKPIYDPMWRVKLDADEPAWHSFNRLDTKIARVRRREI